MLLATNLCVSEIANNNTGEIAFVLKQDVGALDVAMGDLTGVEVFEASENLGKDVEDLGVGEGMQWPRF